MALEYTRLWCKNNFILTFFVEFADISASTVFPFRLHHDLNSCAKYTKHALGPDEA